MPPSWPTPPPSAPLSGVVMPPSAPVTPPQMPLLAPGGIVQGVPGQQSEVLVHEPPVDTQVVPHTKPVPAGLGTQGLPQQSALEAHAVPAGGGPLTLQSKSEATMQRGTPSASCWQTSGWVCTVPAQHLSVALHELLARRQMAPAGEHLLPLSQRPTAEPAGFEQVTLASVPSGRPSAPQQSVSERQISPVGRQPLSGWQTLKPVGP